MISTDVKEAPWPSGRASDSGARCQGFDPHLGPRVVSLSKIHLLVIPRKCWPHPNMTEKLFTGMFSIKKTNRKTKTDVKHVNLKTGLYLNIMHLYCITNY